MELNELKAKAYDLIKTIETAKQMLIQVNQEIAIIQSKPKLKSEKEVENTKK